MPILHSVFGAATFEGADVAVVSQDLVFVAEGQRTNREGARQVAQAFRDAGVEQVEIVQLPYGCGHLDGMLNIIDRDLALIYPTQLPWRVYELLKSSRLSLPRRTGRGRSATWHGDQHGAAGAGSGGDAGRQPGDPRRVRGARRDLPRGRGRRADEGRWVSALHDRCRPPRSGLMMDAGQGIAAAICLASRLRRDACCSTCARSWCARFPPTNARTRWRWRRPNRERTTRSPRCCAWRSAGVRTTSIGPETDPGQLADRILEWEWQREQRQELFPFSEMREPVSQQGVPPAQASWLDWLRKLFGRTGGQG